MGNLIVDLMVENGNLDNEVKRLRALLKGLEEQNKEVAKENKELKVTVEYLQHVKNENKIEIDYLKGHINDQIDFVLNDEILELKNKNDKQSKLLVTLKGKLDTLRRKYRKVNFELEEERKESDNLREQNEHLIRSYNRMKNDLDRVNSDLNKLKSKEYINEKWGRYENTINDLKRELNEYKVREKDYKRDVEQLEKKLKDDRGDCERLYAERHMLMNIKDEKIKEITMLKAKLNIKEKEIDKLQGKYNKLKEINKKLNKSLDYFLERSKVNDEVRNKLNELLNRYIRCATEPSFYLSLEKEIQFNEHLLSTVLFLQQAHLISDNDYSYYTEKITNHLNNLKEGNDNEKR